MVEAGPDTPRGGPGRPGVPAPGRALPGRGRASASSSTSAPACRPGQRARGRPGRGRRTPGSSTSTTTRWCSRTPGAARRRPSGSPIIQADLRSPRRSSATRGLNLDLSRPVALLLVAVLHFVTDDEGGPNDIIARLRDALPPGSHVVILAHLTTEGVPEERVRAGARGVPERDRPDRAPLARGHPAGSSRASSCSTPGSPASRNGVRTIRTRRVRTASQASPARPNRRALRSRRPVRPCRPRAFRRALSGHEPPGTGPVGHSGTSRP